MNNYISFFILFFSFITVAGVVIASWKFGKNNKSSKKSNTPVVSAFFFRFGRRLIYAAALVWGYALFHIVIFSYPTSVSAISVLMRYFGFTALGMLYATYIPGLVLTFFPTFYLNGVLVHMRRALGVSVFFFVALHASIGFIHNLSGNIQAVSFLTQRNQWALVASSIAFSIFSLMALTSFDVAVRLLGQARWKILHRLVYLAGFLAVLHAFLIGSHFTNPTSIIPVIINYLSLTILLLEVCATVKRRIGIIGGIWKKQNTLLWLFLGFTLCIGVISSYVGATFKYDPHAAHRKGYSKDYVLTTVSEPSVVRPNEPVSLRFSITDKRTNRPLKRYQILQEKLMHVVVLRKDLLSYAHIHPEYDNDGTFTVTHTFPTSGTYNLFVEYSPPDFYENLSVATITVGDTSEERVAQLVTDGYTKVFNDEYKVTLTPSGPFRVNDTVDFTLTLMHNSTGEQVTDLEPYLGAFGHMSAASEDLQTYTHVHPLTAPLSQADRGGPSVQFSTFFPKNGKYKLFTQFKHKGEVFVTDFVVEVK